MAMTTRITEDSSTQGVILASAGTSGTFNSTAVSMDAATGRVIVADLNVGVIGTNATVDARLQWSATSGGTYANITGLSIVQDTAGSNLHTIEAKVESIKANYPTATYVRLQVVTAVNATPIAANIKTYYPNHVPIPAGAKQGQVITLP